MAKAETDPNDRMAPYWYRVFEKDAGWFMGMFALFLGCIVAVAITVGVTTFNVQNVNSKEKEAEILRLQLDIEKLKVKQAELGASK